MKYFLSLIRAAISFCLTCPLGQCNHLSAILHPSKVVYVYKYRQIITLAWKTVIPTWILGLRCAGQALRPYSSDLLALELSRRDT